MVQGRTQMDRGGAQMRPCPGRPKPCPDGPRPRPDGARRRQDGPRPRPDGPRPRPNGPWSSGVGSHHGRIVGSAAGFLFEKLRKASFSPCRIQTRETNFFMWSSFYLFLHKEISKSFHASKEFAPRFRVPQSPNPAAPR